MRCNNYLIDAASFVEHDDVLNPLLKRSERYFIWVRRQALRVDSCARRQVHVPSLDYADRLPRSHCSQRLLEGDDALATQRSALGVGITDPDDGSLTIDGVG